ncbi:ATP-binding protein [Psychrobacter sp. UBA3480]|uniref:ATP-binding protein n=1 Tax=Psychrobacter sp. UBA3480 TaxID=1947350 RepID=UPI0025EF7E30|nr:ATP-binding protein [Psychrobacter sp. UBA3480]
MATGRIKTKDRNAIIQSLKSGVTPRTGIQHIQVGRFNELQALIKDIDDIADGGAAFRLVIGDYGSGKTFFLSVVRSIALEKKLVTINADLSPDRRIHASGGQAKALYSELMRNMSTRNKPDGNALSSVVEGFISISRQEADELGVPTTDVIRGKLSKLTELVGGYDFAKVIENYWTGYENGDDTLKSNAIRWLRGEYETKTDARRDLGVRSIIDDAAFYDSLKLLSLFVQQTGYKGLLVNLDELVNLYKLNSSAARKSNYEQVLRILNDCRQGSAENIGFLLGGTPEFLLDTRKGLYSYDALQTRLAGNSFAEKAGVIDYSAPALHLANLTPEELYILLKNLRHVYAGGDEEKYLVPDESLQSFLQHCSKTIGESYFRTPRNTIKAFLDMLTVIDQQPDISWDDLIESTTIAAEIASDADIEVSESDSRNDEFTNFTL